jgi:hypothetical protein
MRSTAGASGSTIGGAIRWWLAIHAAEAAIAHAAAFGACAVKLGNGARLICVHEPHETRVVTVIGRHQRLTRHAFGEPAV